MRPSLQKKKRRSSMTSAEGGSSGGRDIIPLTSIPLHVGGPQKWDATFAGLSALRLQENTIPTLQNIDNENLIVDEFFLSDSVHSIVAHFTMHKV
jgi:hypothetical protein